MEQDLRTGLSAWAIAAIVCNSVVGVLILVLFVILYKACKIPSQPDKGPVFTVQPLRDGKGRQYLLTEA